MATKLFFFLVLPVLLFWAVVLWLFLPRGSTFLIAIFMIGALVFVWGFKIYRELRILEDTPATPVRGVSMGFARVTGRATGEDRLVSPLTNQPCYYYRVHVANWEHRGKDSGWVSYKAKTEARRFYVEDATGRVLVDPKGAEFDSDCTFHAEIGPRSKNSRFVDPSLGISGLSEPELRALVAANPQLMAGLLQSNDGPLVRPADLFRAGVTTFNPGESYRFTEYCLLADRECTVLGTCAENPSPKDQNDRNMIAKGVSEKTFLISTKAEMQEEKRLRRSAVRRVLLGAGIMIGVTAFAVAVSKPQPARRGGSVSKITLRVEPAEYTGPCPARITFRGTIVTDGAARVTFHYTSSPALPKSSAADWSGSMLWTTTGGTFDASRRITFYDQGSPYSTAVRLQSDHPNANSSPPVEVTINCLPAGH